MRTLVIDTATEILSVALIDETRCLAHLHKRVGRGHAERLIPAIAGFPEGGRADLIAVDVGPGSFTGVRIGLAAAKALAFGWGCPAVGYTSLSIIAAAVVRKHEPTNDFPIVIVGGHGELFWQIFPSRSDEPATAIRSTPIATLASTLSDEVVYGSGAKALVSARGYGTAVDVEANSLCYPLINVGAALPLTPVYGRGADAKPMADRSLND
ncbi:tRNA (adenosine(37)-N6)-threonylcarbamoyltransferase complex dimerization subunit type 1 TsaB [Sphingobium sp. SCG-1]|uniref:tRNA (adenosine(37)-N6)-threonylcarbamoyltransferase complex dimerization subunit type 1 TsaB n=1 Tax=Sphingobium sp. SCG-1 TaxID=2072936 RepID=UPI000CD68394|nr:tRNA (adenosine(37)-N6)-threonylcarbamoyltransferase complex dimerization subunit type 1 TsaB [Sphingobium sp. SCG-1]AUW58678.1 tRNA (adenosine(37)-N6)-threonylcarbamoyltransferase complex dimerization subunit type 1 TsaB [Sphingobium sp. SCG-1]